MLFFAFIAWEFLQKLTTKDWVVWQKRLPLLFPLEISSLGSSGSEGESSWKDQIYIYLNHTDTPDILDEFNGNVSNILAIRMTCALFEILPSTIFKWFSPSVLLKNKIQVSIFKSHVDFVDSGDNPSSKFKHILKTWEKHQFLWTGSWDKVISKIKYFWKSYPSLWGRWW